MAHPYASQAKASQKARLGRLGAKAGKSFGSSSMYKKTSYPAKNAGSSTPLTIAGKAAKKRADRPSNRFAAGGFVGGGGGGTKKKKGHSTTNIIIASPGGGGAAQPRPVPVPVPVNRPVPVPVGGGVPPAPRPPMGPPGAGGPPINVNVPPPPAAAGPAMPPPGLRPPGMAGGGQVGYNYHNWGKGYASGGAVKKKARGGAVGGGPYTEGAKSQGKVSHFLPDSDYDPSTAMGKTGPSSDEAQTDEVGATRRMKDTFQSERPFGDKRKDGGGIKKKAFGGPAAGGLGAAGPRRPFTPGAVPGGRPGLGAAPGVRPPAAGGIGARPPVVPLTGRPTRPGYKKGGVAHDDEAQDKKLFKKMIKQEDEAEGKKSGGSIKGYDDGGLVDDDVTPQASSTSVSAPANPADSSKTAASGIMKALTGVNKAMNPTASAGGDNAAKAALAAQTAAEKSGQAAAASTQSLGRTAQAGFKPGAVPGAFGGAGGNKFQIAKDGGGIKKLKAGGATGQGRLDKIAGARKVPAKTEI